MTENALFWFAATLFWTFVMSFYSTQEMACISYNKLRLEYAVKQGSRRERWILSLIENPGILFSTTLIGVNVALMASSECSRRLYEALGLNPNLSPITHIPFILLFGELVPMFAARIYSEHMCRLGIPFLMLSAKILTPITKIIDYTFTKIKETLGVREQHKSLLSREELQKLIEEHEIGVACDFDTQFDAIIGNIFAIRSKQASLLMQPLNEIPTLPASAHVSDLAPLFKKHPDNFVLIYHKVPHKIIGVIFPQDVCDAPSHKRASECVRSVPFVTETEHALDIIKELQEEEQELACVLNTQGQTVGVVTLRSLFEELFETEEQAHTMPQKQLSYLEKTFLADTLITDFNEAYGLKIDPQGCTTFAELIEKTLGRNPNVGDTLLIEPLEITIKDTSLFKAKTIMVCLH